MSDEADHLEQLANMREVASATRTLFNAFLEQGFTEAQALALVHTWLNASIGAVQP